VDLKGKALGVPVYELLGGINRNSAAIVAAASAACGSSTPASPAAHRRRSHGHRDGDARSGRSDETIHLGPLAVRFLITGEDASGSVALFELTVPAAKRLAGPAHSHDHYEETIYGIEGVLTWTVDGKRVDVGPGQALCIPRGAVHRFDNAGSQDVKALCAVTPAAIGPQFFRSVPR
jgi:quercetin dioxygenase-like cupin family protein